MARALRERHARATRADRIVERKMKKVVGEFKRGQLRSGAGLRVRSRRQAVAIGLSEVKAHRRPGPEAGPPVLTPREPHRRRMAGASGRS